MEKSTNLSNQWAPREKIVFRFFFIFYVTRILGWLFSLFPWLPRQITWDSFLMVGYRQSWDNLVDFIGKIILNVNVGENSGSDSLFAYVEIFAQLIIAIIGCVIWSLADRKRNSYRILFYWLAVYVRYSLAAAMLSYGFSKLFFLQFNSRLWDLENLVRPYGNFSPPQLLANFMGYSKSYQFFTGIAEVLGGLLILFRRTTTIGALILIGVMSNVFMLNLNFGFGVISYSLELLLQATFLLVIDGRRFINFFFLNKPIPALESQPLLPKRWMRVVKAIMKIYFIFFLGLYSNIQYNLQYYSTYVRGPNPPLHGIYKVESFVINNDTIPPIFSDTIRWDRMVVSFPGWVNIHMMNDSSIMYDYKPDIVNKRFIISSYSDTLDKYVLNYSESRSGILILHGTWKQDSVFMQLQKEDINKYELRRWKTGWLNRPIQ